MHLRCITKVEVAPAQSVEAILDIINQVISTLVSIELLFGIDFSELSGKSK